MNAINQQPQLQPFGAAVFSGPECLRIEQLSKRFGDFVALRDIELSVQEGEFVCFLGPSGCGKTTLLRAIAGLEQQSEGRIIQQGRDISLLPPQLRDFGIVFQSYALFPNLSVLDNIAYGLRNQRQDKSSISQRVEELLTLIGLEDSADKYPAQLSGGQQQRVALARALATRPGLLLLDEPLSALDARVRVHLRQQIKKLQQELGVTTIMVTHDQEEALTLADRIVVMNQGVIEQIGTPQEIYHQPTNAFVAGFVGSMNLLDAVVDTPNSVRVGERCIRLVKTHGLPQHSAVRLAIRPEAVRLCAEDEVNCNGVQARLVDVEFMGAFLRVHCVLESGSHPLQVDLPMSDLAHLQQASCLQLHLPEQSLQVFAGAAA